MLRKNRAAEQLETSYIIANQVEQFIEMFTAV
jgi:hypothetical protein